MQLHSLVKTIIISSAFLGPFPAEISLLLHYYTDHSSSHHSDGHRWCPSENICVPVEKHRQKLKAAGLTLIMSSYLPASDSTYCELIYRIYNSLTIATSQESWELWVVSHVFCPLTEGICQQNRGGREFLFIPLPPTYS